MRPPRAILGIVLFFAIACSEGVTSDASLPDGSVGDGGRTDAGSGGTTVERGPVCSPDGWCWEAPLPAGGPVFGIAAPARGHAVAAGLSRFFHVDPGASVGHAVRPGAEGVYPVSLWGSAPDDVWSTSGEGVLHFDGETWALDPSGPVALAIHGVARDDVWAVGQRGAFHYDGAGWSSVVATDPSSGLSDVWAIGPGEAIVVGATTRHVRTDGTSTDLGGPTARSVYASSADDVWILPVGSSGLVRRAGGTWSPVDVSTSFLGDLWGSGSDVWVGLPLGVGRWDGTTMVEMRVEGAASPLSMAGTGPSDVWVGDRYDGSIHHYDGASWSSSKSPLASDDLVDIAATDEGRAMAIGRSQTVLQRDASGAWSIVPVPPAWILTGVARAGEELLLFANTGTHRLSGGAWELFGAGMTDACTTSDGTTWGVADQRIARYDTAAGEWSLEPSLEPTARLTRVHCVGAEAWAVALGSPVFHLEAGVWAEHGSELIDPIAFGVDAEGRTLAVRPDLSIWRRDAGVFAQIVAGPADLIAPAVAAEIVAADQVWALGGSTDGMRRFDGTRWSRLTGTNAIVLAALAATPDGTLYAAGAGASILRRAP